MHTDGTSKFGEHYSTYDVVKESGEKLVAGIREVSGGDCETQMNVLKEILKEIEESLQDSESQVSQKICSSIKNIMSDHHIVQKKFNSVFQDFRSNILPDVVHNWDELSQEAKNKLINVNSFFCGMHFVVGLADQAEVALKAWDKLLFDEKPVRLTF